MSETNPEIEEQASHLEETFSVLPPLPSNKTEEIPTESVAETNEVTNDSNDSNKFQSEQAPSEVVQIEQSISSNEDPAPAPRKMSGTLGAQDGYTLGRDEAVLDAVGALPAAESNEVLNVNNTREWYQMGQLGQDQNNTQVRPAGANTVQSTLLDDSVDSNAEDTDENIALLDGSHPLMARVQEAIRAQLTRRLEQLELELREKEEEAKKGIQKREEVGMDLYNMQQQLARLQAMFEGAEENFGIIRGMREEAERRLKNTSSEYKMEQEKLQQHRNNLEQHKLELEKISRSLRQVDLYNEELRSKILVAKRTTLKAEEDIAKLEIEKKRQDFFINDLTEQLRQLQERRALYEHQLVSQQKETKATIETLQEAEMEMEAIQYEKRQLLNQWKSSLIGLQRRDDVLQQIQQGIQKNNETLASMMSEIAGYRRAHRKAQEEGESLSNVLSKLNNEADYLTKQISSVTEQREKLNENYAIYMKSLQKAEHDLAQLQQERNLVQQEINAIQKAALQNAQATQKLEAEIAERLQQQLTLKKGSQGAKRDGAKLRAKIHEKETHLAALQNEVSTVRLEALNVAARIDRMRDRVSNIDTETEERNALIEKYEQDFKRKSDELAKKASEMDLLNKKYNQVTGGNEEEHMGPWEATIHNLAKSISAKEQECTQLQQYWLKAQNELVSINKQSIAITDEIQTLKTRLTVLNRKKMMVNNAFETEEREIKDHQRMIRQLQNDMVKINTLLSKQSNAYGKLEESNLELEQEFRARLKKAELESIHMEKHLEDIKAEKEQALRGLVEAERQIMLWEKKIQLAKETQQALDPNVGATEIREMELEIHRMKLRYTSMMKLQEKMIAEMEKSVYRRESIATRGQTKGKGSTQMVLQKSIADLTKKVKQTIQDIKECDQDIVTLEKSQHEVTRHIQESRQQVKSLEEKEIELHQTVEQVAVKKALISSETLLQQRHLRRYQDLKENKYTFVALDVGTRMDEATKSKMRLQRIYMVLQALVNQTDPKMKPLLSPFIQFYEKHIRDVQV